MKLPKGLTMRGNIYWMRRSVTGYGLVQRSLETDNLGQALITMDAILRDPARYLNARDDFADYAADQARRALSARWVADTRIVLESISRKIDADPRRWTPQKLQAWQASIPNSRTAAAYLQRVQTFCAWMVREGRMPRSPCDSLPKSKTAPSFRRRFLSRQEAAALLDAAPDEEMRFVIYCALHAGLRKGEIIAARPGWFDLNAGLLHIQNEADWLIKDRTDRTIPLTAEFLQFLSGYGLRSPYMLAPEVTKGKHRYRYDFNRRFQAMKQSTGIDCTFHDLRRTFASLLVSKGVSVYKVAKWLGDGVAVVEKHYGHLAAQDSDINAAWQ